MGVVIITTCDSCDAEIGRADTQITFDAKWHIHRPGGEDSRVTVEDVYCATCGSQLLEQFAKFTASKAGTA